MEWKLRTWREGDEISIAKYANNPKVAKNLRNSFPYPYTLQDAKDYLSFCFGANTNEVLLRAIEMNGEAVGSVGVFVQTDVYCKNAELGYWLGEPFWRKSIMSTAVRQICEEAFRIYDINRIYAEPFADNTASCKTLEKAGFTLEGVMKKAVWKNDEYHDYCMYALIR